MVIKKYLPLLGFLIAGLLLAAGSFADEGSMGRRVEPTSDHNSINQFLEKFKSIFGANPRYFPRLVNTCSGDIVRPAILNDQSAPKLEQDPFAPMSPWILGSLDHPPIDKPIKIKFSKVMSIASMNSGTIKMYEGYVEDQGKLIDTKIEYTPSDSTVTITPSGKLKYSTNYSLHIGGENEVLVDLLDEFR